MSTRTGGRTPSARWLAWLAVAGLTTAALFAPTAASAAELNKVDGTDDCPAGLDGFKIDETANHLEEGVYTFGEYSVEIYDVVESEEGEVIAFSFKNADPLVLYVFVKGGQADGNYDYRPDGVDADEDLELDDQKGISHISFCYGDVEPTPTPTEAPTATPTEAPTATPTEAPTATPTEAPTATPTEAPTATPTEAPTATPTEAPTATPTGSVAPTESTPPTDAPTATPTGGVGGATGTPGTTLPPTDALDGQSSAGESWRLIVLAMAGILAAALLLTPARVVRKADRD